MREIEKAIRELDDQLKPEDNGFMAAKFVLASTTRPHNGDKLAKATGISRSLAREFARNCRRNKIWKEGKIGHSGWFDEKTGGLSFWLDVNCVQGYMERSNDDS